MYDIYPDHDHAYTQAQLKALPDDDIAGAIAQLKAEIDGREYEISELRDVIDQLQDQLAELEVEVAEREDAAFDSANAEHVDEAAA
jgi:hypothetical protein